MPEKEEFTRVNLVHRFEEEIRDRIDKMKPKYPLLLDYLNVEMDRLYTALQKHILTSPVLPEDYAVYFLVCHGIIRNLDEIEFEGFSYLWDSKLYTLMKMIMKNNLGVSNKWVKVLLASNTLELALNKALMIHKKDDFPKLKDKDILSKMEIVNEILVSKNHEKLNRSDILFIKSHRVDADHPIPDVINELDDKNVSDVIEHATNALTKLQPLLEEKQTPKVNTDNF